MKKNILFYSVIIFASFSCNKIGSMEVTDIKQAKLYPKGTGSATSPIRIGSYGAGAKPKVFLSGTIGTPVYLFNQLNWIIENPEVSNYSATRGDVFRKGIFIQNTEITFGKPAVMLPLTCWY